jgi:hypothetical protein
MSVSACRRLSKDTFFPNLNFGAIFVRSNAMKKFILLVFVFLISTCIQAQDTSEYAHPAKISFIGEEVFFPQRSFVSFGFQLEASVSRHVYLNYHFSIGTTSQGGFYGHATLGGAGGAALVAAAIGEKGVGWLALFLCFIPEGVGYKIPLGGRSELVPYFNPAQAEYLVSKEGEDEFNFSGDAGCRYLIKMHKLYFFQVHLGAKLLYNNGEWGAEGGASIGKYF